jgi:GntR family transcriptional regulator / MocR family aminotransferase
MLTAGAWLPPIRQSQVILEDDYDGEFRYQSRPVPALKSLDGACCHSLYMDSPRFIPAVVTQFMTEGHFARHIRRMRQLYAERRAALAEALARTLRRRLRVELQAGGMHLRLARRRFPRRERRAACLCSRARGQRSVQLAR